jgi:FixJ family two-component response regulator/anti-sigma regulatory factor (Ser/Thr protein kinase)
MPGSSPNQLSPRRGRVLGVEDDAISRRALELHLQRSGFDAVMASDAAQARTQFTLSGSSRFDCVVTDFRMPGETGAELLTWLRTQDATLSSIMLTAKGERQIVLDSLRAGACDFIEKPYRQMELASAIDGAIKCTRDQRWLSQTQAEALAVGQTQRRLLAASSGTLTNGVVFCHYPKHGAGGDFFTVFPLDQDRLLVLVADVSGHDLQAAFISAYFQGITRGMLEKQTKITAILNFFNCYLIHEWNHWPVGLKQAPTSIAVCALVLDRRAGEITVFNSGAPAPRLMGGELDRCARALELGGHPLGWFEDSKPEVNQLLLPLDGGIILWTDGLEDHAHTLGVSDWSLAYRLLTLRADNEATSRLEEAPDDILVVRLPVGLDRQVAVHTLLDECYPGSGWPLIDDFQARWERSLKLALPAAAPQRLDEICLCLREACLNALRHGCQQQPDQSARVVIAYEVGPNRLRVLIDDPGSGHSFDWQTHEQRALEELIAEHRGLSLINAFADSVYSERNGARLTLEFALTPGSGLTYPPSI